MSVITISRGTKSGGLELARRLSGRLGYKTLSMEDVIAETARKYNIMGDMLLDKLENTPSLWQKFTDEYARFLIFIQCSILKAIKEDNLIYHGYAGQLFLRDLPHVLKLRIEAPMEYRLKAVMEEFGYSEEKAETYIRKIDSRRKRWYRMVYNDDWYNPALYDLWINMRSISMDNICDMVAGIISHKDFKSSPATARLLDNKALECEVRAALASDDKIWRNQQVTVIASSGIVTLKGTVKTRELLDLIIDTTSKVKGVKKVNADISLLSQTKYKYMN